MALWPKCTSHRYSSKPAILQINTMDYSHQYHQQSPQLPSGWMEAVDPTTGRIYYANATTGESSWDIPLLQHQPNPHPPPPPQYSVHQNYQYPQQPSNINVNDFYSNNNLNSSETNAFTYHTSGNHNSGTTVQLCHVAQQQQPQQAWSSAPTHQSQMMHPANTVQNDAYASNTLSSDVTTTNDTNIKKEYEPIDHELRMLSAGQIADLCYIQQQLQYDNNDTDASVPVSYQTPLTIAQHQRPRQEIGRLQTRYYTLREQLKQFHIF